MLMVSHLVQLKCSVKGPREKPIDDFVEGKEEGSSVNELAGIKDGNTDDSINGSSDGIVTGCYESIL